MQNASTPECLSLLADSKAGVNSVVNKKKISHVFAPEAGVYVKIVNDHAYNIQFYEPGVLESSGESEPVADPLSIWRVFDPDEGTNEYKRLSFLHLMDGETNNLVEYEWSSDNSLLWKTGDELRKDEVSWSYGLDGGVSNRIDIHQVINEDDTVAERIVRTYRHYVFGDKLILEQKGAEGEEVTTSIIEYYEDPGHQGRYGNIARKMDERGSWVRYDYDLEGRKVLEVTPWLDGDADAPDTESVVTLYDYTCVDTRETPRFNDRRWRTRLRMVADQWVSTSYRAYVDDGIERIVVEEEAEDAASTYGDAANRRTTRRENGPGSDPRLRLKPLSIIHPDGTEDTWEYSAGTYTVTSPGIGEFAEQEEGDFIRVTETLKANMLEPYKSTRTVSILDAFGREVQTETWVCTGVDQWERMDWQTISRDEFGRELVRCYANGLTKETTWDCCGKESETKPDGQSWSYVQDMLGRTTFAIKEDGPAEATVYDAAGKVLSKTLSGGGLSLSTSNRYDLAGRMVESWDEAGLSTTTEYGERTETVTRPGGATETTARFRDGNVKSITGTGVVPQYYEYGVGADDGQWTKTFTGSTNAPAWTLTVRGREGRRARTEQPGFGGTVITNIYKYDDEGRLVRESKTGGLDNLYVYDTRGELFRSGTDVDGNGLLDLASMDRIQEQWSAYVLSGSDWFQQRTTIGYPSDGSAAPFTNSITRTQVGGSGCACEAGWGESVDARGNVYATQTSVDPLLKTVTKTVTRSGIANPETTVISNGLLQTRTLPAVAEYRYLYDGLGRQVGIVDPRTGTNRTVYLANGRVDYVEDAAGYRTTIGYDAATGRRLTVTDALTNTVYTAYDIQGKVTNTWGATYPVAYEYDAYGRMTAMKTWRDTNGAPDVTRWYYDETSGLLTNKVYADGVGPSYEYDAAGRLTKRIWARGVETDYAYDALGQLTNIAYSDNTPDVAFTYDRLGRQLTATDALGTRTNHYDALTLLEERLPDGTVLARSVDSFGRPSGIALDADYAIGYGFDEFGRFAAVAVSNGVQFAYSYVPDSDLLSGWSVSNGAGSAYAYEPNRNLRTDVVNTFDGSPVSAFAYAYDAAGRRTQRVDSGLTTNLFGYNMKSELADAIMGTNIYAYLYDPIGNCQLASVNEVTNLYQANELNQYTNINEGAVVPVYDADGNMTSYGSWQFTWDAENRLISVSSNGVPVVQNQYDYMSRRVMKATATQTNTFLYDGWNLIRENIGAATTSSRSYVWGLDLSGTLQGAGGVGGLLCWIEGRDGSPSRPFFPSYDANGNITDLVDTNGTVVAHYEYDPYGNTIAKSGDQADTNPFRFSSKYRDGETGFYYYGYRFYSPSLGRWLNRDPIEEEGGINLFVFVDNAPPDLFDAFGDRAISFEINGPQSPLGVSFFLRFSAVWTECPVEIEGGLFGAAEWQPPGLRFIQRPMDWFNIHVELGARGGIQGKVKYSECFGLQETKICGRIEAFGRAEYRRRGYRDPRGRFTRFRFGAGADGGCDLCLDLCSGNVSLDCALNYYAYLHFGFADFNRTYNYGGALSGSWQLGSFPQAAVLKDYCNKSPDPNNCCCIEKYGRAALTP
jgi:RHS repeat-associated protein